MTSPEPARRHYRVLTRTRGGYEGAIMYDVQLQAQATGALVWAQTFSDHAEAQAYEAAVTNDLERLDATTFRQKYGVPAGH